MSAEDVALAQSLTDVATIAILQERNTRQLRDLSAQLQSALDSRVVVEQAKGVIAQSLDLEVAEAFEILGAHARSTNQRLRAVAADVVDRRIVLAAPDTARPARTRR